jgi:excisionase family DNA binding protein
MDTPNTVEVDSAYPLKKFLTADDVASALQISRSAAYKLMNASEFPCVRIGRLIRVRSEYFEEYLSKNERFIA